MRTTMTMSTPLSSREVARLRAGDDVSLTAQILLLAIDEDDESEQTANTLPAMIEGRICCLASGRVEHNGDPRWQLARIDIPAVDRVACSLLAAGALALLASGRCSATLSYALRKYRGLYFAVDADWLHRVAITPAAPATIGDHERIGSAVIDVDQVTLTVAHDAQGYDLGRPR
jgi:tartrate dehydratase beta subunit/fumarate hydratase class I family protein